MVQASEDDSFYMVSEASAPLLEREAVLRGEVIPHKKIKKLSFRVCLRCGLNSREHWHVIERLRAGDMQPPKDGPLSHPVTGLTPKGSERTRVKKKGLTDR